MHSSNATEIHAKHNKTKKKKKVQYACAYLGSIGF